MALTLPTNVIAGDTGHINAHNTIHLATNGFIFSASAFFIPATSVSDSTAGRLMLASARAAASGVASLDGSSLLPAAQLPAVTMRRDQPNLQTPITGIIIENYNNAAPFALLTLRGGKGTQASPVANANGDIIAALFLSGQTNTTYGTGSQTGAGMRARTTQAWGAGTTGAQLEFFTYPNTTSGGVINAMTIGQDQSVACLADMSVAGNSTLTGTLTVTGVATFNGGISAANVMLIDGTTNSVTSGSGIIPMSGTAGAFFQAVKDSGALTGAAATMFTLQARGATDSAHTIGSAGRIEFLADAAFSAGSSPGRISFRTTPTGSTTEVVRLQINNAGKMFFGLTQAAAVATIDQSGVILSTATTGAIGYGTGAGGSVTQGGAVKTQGVTLNTPCGQVTTNTASLASATVVSFVVTNSAVAALDGVVVWIVSGGTLAAYQIWVSAVAAGSFTISIRNTTAGSLSEAIVIGFEKLAAVIT